MVKMVISPLPAIVRALKKLSNTGRAYQKADRQIRPTRKTGSILALAGLVIALNAVTQHADAMSHHPEDFKCDEAKAINGNWDRVQCYFDKEPYIPPGESLNFPAAYITPHNLPTNNSLKLILDLHGYTPFPTNCEVDDGARAGVLLIKNCAAHYPSQFNYSINGSLPMGWWGIFKGTNSNGHRMVESTARAMLEYKEAIDWGAGIRLQGTSYGGTGAILQSMLLPNPVAQRLITVVHANVPQTLFVKKDTTPGDGIDSRGQYFRDPAVQMAWGDFDINKADFAKAAEARKVSHIYYRINGATNDDLGRVDLDFFRICDQYKIACFGTWHRGGHVIAEAGVNLPFSSLFNSPKQDVRLNQPLPIFTQSSANNFGERGHYNLGLAWNSEGIEIDREQLVVPIRYKRHSNIAPLVDQPVTATFNLTLRHIGRLDIRKGNTLSWSLGSQEGTVTVAGDRTVTVEGLRLTSADNYTNFVVTHIESAAPEAIVYTRMPRARTPVAGTAIEEAANWQHVTDVGRINFSIAESDVVIDDLNGIIDVIHNCTTSPEICVAQEARVSPDGSKIVYSVGYGDQLHEVQYNGIKLGIYEIGALTHAALWIHDLATGVSYPIPNNPENVIDRQPDWLDNDTIIFASNAGSTYPYKNQFPTHQALGRCFNPPACVSQEYGYGPASKSMQIWAMDIDGTDARNLTPHEQNALSPTVMSNGDIVYSCWNAHGNKSHDASTSIGPSTSKNKWWLCRMDGNGAGSSVVLNGHKTPTLKTRGWLTDITGGEGRSQLRAVRSAAEILKDKLAVTNYYRGNHGGSMGIVFGMDYTNPEIEGCSTAECFTDTNSLSSQPGSGRYVPKTLRAITPYGTDQDTDVRRDAQGRALGKAGYPAPYSQEEYLITHARGSCYEITQPYQATREWTGGEPTCQKAIYKVKVPMVTNPFDTNQMEMIAGGDAWQAYDARALTTYQQIYGQALPVQPEPLDAEQGCYLQVVDARKSELYAPQPYNWMTNLYEQCNTQGCAVNSESPTFLANTTKNFTVYLAEMWDFSYSGENRTEFSETMNNMGHKSISLLDSQPLQADGSVKMQVPCETPLIMAGTDSSGMKVSHDEMLHSLRPGETRTCHGCHDGHSEERAAEIGESAVKRFERTLAHQTNPPLSSAWPPITFDLVRPILENRCQGCHQDMNDANGLLYSRITQDYEQIDWPWMERKLGPRGDYQLSRPYTSKWIAKFARDSLLYWKCKGARQDGRSDAKYGNDIDFGPAHNSGATAQECQVIGLWIDSGIQF